MTVCEILESEGIDTFGAIKLDNCIVTKERLISDANASSLYAIMLVLPYPRAPKGSLFASFSLIADYHKYFTDILFEKLAKLECFRNKYMKVFADHSPIDERHAAASAGLGVIGDNGLFISSRHGSFVFLGEIICSLSDKELNAQGIPLKAPREPEGCLKCGRCAKCCPAGCIGGDKSLCVSNLTQKKGVLSDTERDIIRKSGMVWGCDACADVCPMNEDKTLENYNRYFKKSFFPEKYEDIERLGDEEYAAYPFSWRKKEIIERNFEIFTKPTSKE